MIIMRKVWWTEDVEGAGHLDEREHQREGDDDCPMHAATGKRDFQTIPDMSANRNMQNIVF